MGKPQDFLQNEGKRWAAEFGDNAAGSAEFTKIWKGIASRETEAFRSAQHDYIKHNYYDVLAKGIKDDIGLDINSRSSVLQDVAWSTAVQHGSNTTIFQTALEGKDVNSLSDAEIIKLVYAERGRKDDKGRLVHFIHSSEEVQADQTTRFSSEQSQALKKLNGN